MDTPQPAGNSLDRLLDRLHTRAGSLIITVFGDTVMPRGGSIWLGSLIRLMAPLKLSERLVRTGVYRLAREGWLASRNRGRKAYYHLTPSGIATFAEAERRIYAAAAPAWDGTWTLLHLLPALSPSERTALRSQLGWSGFGQLSPNLFIHTGQHPLPEGAKKQAALAFHAKLGERIAATPAEVAAMAWDLARLNTAYGAFRTSFEGFERPLAEPEEAFAVTTLMVHEYRRILLHDPQLPGELLPAGWAGHTARELAARLYHRHADKAGTFVASHMESWQGLAPQPSASYFGRFRLQDSRDLQGAANT